MDNPENLTIDGFAEDIFKRGVYVLECGGGVIAEPRWAIVRLKRRYGIDGLRPLALKLQKESAFGKDFKEGVVWCASGILYHLDDNSTFDELLKLRGALLESGRYIFCEQRRTAVDTLIAGLAQKLGLPVPHCLEKLTDRDIAGEFSPDNF